MDEENYHPETLPDVTGFTECDEINEFLYTQIGVNNDED